MIRDYESHKEDLSAYFKSNPKDWEMIKWELECQRELAKERACEKQSTEYEKGIVQGIKIALQIEHYYKTWTKLKKI